MYSFVPVLAILLASSQAISYEDVIQEQWELFKIQHDKFYDSEEEHQYRQEIFLENLHKITKHNQDYERGLTSYTMGINIFADLTSDEFLRLYTTNISQSEIKEGVWGKDFIIYDPFTVNDTDLPSTVDWRQKNVVTRVKDQGQCKSCWSFSTTGALEGQWAITHHNLLALSEQNLVDCDLSNNGCHGGFMDNAFEYIRKNGGIDTEASYPYEGRTGPCRYNPRNKGATVSKTCVVPKGENSLKSAVSQVGPISVAINVVNSFRHYHGGIYDEPRCGSVPSHAVLAVGYGSENGKDYWLVKNSYSKRWGEQGYIRMRRNRGNQCNIASFGSYPLV